MYAVAPFTVSFMEKEIDSVYDFSVKYKNDKMQCEVWKLSVGPEDLVPFPVATKSGKAIIGRGLCKKVGSLDFSSCDGKVIRLADAHISELEYKTDSTNHARILYIKLEGVSIEVFNSGTSGGECAGACKGSCARN